MLIQDNTVLEGKRHHFGGKTAILPPQLRFLPRFMLPLVALAASLALSAGYGFASANSSGTPLCAIDPGLSAADFTQHIALLQYCNTQQHSKPEVSPTLPGHVQFSWPVCFGKGK